MGGNMILKRWFIWVILFFSLQSFVNAQIHGLSVVDTADLPGKGTMHVAGNTFVAETSALYGGRFAYGVTERLLVFTDMGVHDADHFDPEFLGQAGMRYTLPLNLPFDLAVRATTIPYIASYEHCRVHTGTFGEPLFGFRLDLGCIREHGNRPSVVGA